MRIPNRCVAGAFAIAALTTAACGGNKVTGPSTTASVTSATSPASTTGASIAGTVVGVSGAASAPFRTMATGMTVTVTGTNLSSAVDDSGHFEVHGVPAGRVEIRFSGRGADAALAFDNVAEHEDIRLVVRVNGSAAEIEGDDHGGGVELNGAVAGKAGTCPALSFSVGAAKVVTSNRTEFKDVTCGALANNDQVEVKGSRRTDGTVDATRVEKKR